MGATFAYFLRPKVCMNYGSSAIKTNDLGFDITRTIFLNCWGVNLTLQVANIDTPKYFLY